MFYPPTTMHQSARRASEAAVTGEGGQAGRDSSGDPSPRVLIIDDTPAIHQDFRRILSTPEGPTRLRQMGAALFGTLPPLAGGYHFEVDSAYQGEEGIERVRAAREEGRPYALAFIDIRMPPGLDGVETTARLWQEEPDLQVVLCSAYTDYSWEEVTQRLGISQRLLILRKPFDSIEVRQLAHALAEKWELLHRDRRRMEDLTSAVKARTQELEQANRRLRREVEERLQLEAQLSHSRRLDALGQLAAGLAHEVNNPLSYVISNLHHIRRELSAPRAARSLETDAAELQDACNDALVGCERIQRLVQDVRLFARMGGGACRAPVDVCEALEESLAMVRCAMAPDIRLVTELRPVPAVLADAHGLGQVFVNLLINAAQALEKGPGAPCIRVATGVRPEDGRVWVEVQDNGRGILPEHLGRIFEPFFTTKPVGVGTGLGLSICHSYVQAMGGDIRVRSEVGRGTTFEVVLRSAEEGSPDAPLARATASEAKGSRGRLLLIDDEPLLLAALSRTLAPEHEVEGLSGARPALERLRAGERYSLILCDVMMPEMTGLELYVTLVREVPEQAERMVFLTGGAFSEASRASLEASRRPCVDKPFEPEALRGRIHELLEAHGRSPRRGVAGE